MVDKQSPPEELDIVLFSSLLPERVEWLWPGRIPLGKLTVITGEAGLGKSLLSFDIAARVSRGGDWPDSPDAATNSSTPAQSTEPAAPGKVLLLNGDHHLADTVGPCLAAAQADCERIVAIKGMWSQERHTGGPSRGINLLRHLPLLREQLQVIRNVRLVVIDPLVAYCGRVSRHPTDTSHRIAATLSELAAEFRVAILVVTDDRHAGLPCPTAWTVHRDPFNPERRLWSPSTFQYGPRPGGLHYRIAGRRITWEPGSVGLTPEQILSSIPLKRGALRQRVVGDWLSQLLRDGPRDSSDIYTAGAALGLSTTQIWRAKSLLNVEITKAKEHWGKWIWELPKAV